MDAIISIITRYPMLTPFMFFTGVPTGLNPVEFGQRFLQTYPDAQQVVTYIQSMLF